jgi:hypothetical protein
MESRSRAKQSWPDCKQFFNVFPSLFAQSEIQLTFLRLHEEAFWVHVTPMGATKLFDAVIFA